MTEEQEKIDGAHSGGVYEIVPMRDTEEMQDNRRIYESHTDEFHRRLAEDQSVDSTSCLAQSCCQ